MMVNARGGVYKDCISANSAEGAEEQFYAASCPAQVTFARTRAVEWHSMLLLLFTCSERMLHGAIHDFYAGRGGGG